jgi:Uma2 family endonuclease
MIAQNRSSTMTTPSLKDLVEGLGEIPLERIRLLPPPGQATINDVEHNKCCELVDGTLVEKAMGLPEAMLATVLSSLIQQFASARKLGLVAGADGAWEVLPDLVRMPDVAYISWERLPERRLPDEPIPHLAPDLAIEVLSKSNTPAEMARKCAEYFQAGVRQVWQVDRFALTVTMFTSAMDSRVLTSDDTIDGGDVLPGFSLKVADLFAALERKE